MAKNRHFLSNKTGKSGICQQKNRHSQKKNHSSSWSIYSAVISSGPSLRLIIQFVIFFKKDAKSQLVTNKLGNLLKDLKF